MVANGRTSKEIGSALGISESTVNWHLANVFAKLGVSSRAEAVARAYVANGQERPYASSLAGPVPTPQAWPRLIAIAIAIAIAAALLGGVTVATFRVGPIPILTPSPANRSDGVPTSSPSSGSRQDLIGAEIAPTTASQDPMADPTGSAPPASPATLTVPIVSPSLVTSPTMPTIPIPSVTSLPLPMPSPDLPLPSPIPTPRLSLP